MGVTAKGGKGKMEKRNRLDLWRIVEARLRAVKMAGTPAIHLGRLLDRREAAEHAVPRWEGDVN